VRICHPYADSYRDMDPNQIYKQHETEKKSQYASRILEVEQASNLFPRVLSLPRESTLVAAGHVSIYGNEIPIGSGSLT